MIIIGFKLFLICAVSAVSLSTLNIFTKEPIENHKIEAENTVRDEFVKVFKEELNIYNCSAGSKVVLSDKEKVLKITHKDNKAKFGIVRDWIEENEQVQWVEPSGGVVCFPWINPSVKVDVNKFNTVLNEKYGTFIGPGHWFGQSDRFFRIGYSFPEIENLKEGLESIIKSIDESNMN